MTTEMIQPKMKRDWRLHKTIARLPWYKKATVVFPTAALMALSGVAGAFFIAEGNGTGSGNVTVAGAPAPVSLTVVESGSLEGGTFASATPLSPEVTPIASDTQYDVYSINGTKAARIGTLTGSVKTDGSGNVLNSAAAGAPVVGCLASWFLVGTPVLNKAVTGGLAGNWRPTGGTALPYVFAANETGDYAGFSVSFHDTGTDQSVCEGVSPETQLVVS